MGKINTMPPKWQPDAIPSKQGWRHPKTNELLVSVKLAAHLYENLQHASLTDLVTTATNVIENIIDETLPDQTAPIKRGPGRRKLNKITEA